MNMRGRVRLRDLAACCLLAFLLTACTVGPRNFENENDRLRELVLELEQQNEELSQLAQRRLNQIEALEQQAGRRHALRDAVDPARVPRFVAAKITSRSTAIDRDNDDVLDAIRIYVRTLDQDDRFIPVAGTLVAQLVTIDPETGPTELARRQLSPREFDEAYRSHMLGTYYRIDLPIAQPAREAGEGILKVTVTDAETGVKASDQMPLRIGEQTSR